MNAEIIVWIEGLEAAAVKEAAPPSSPPRSQPQLKRPHPLKFPRHPKINNNSRRSRRETPVASESVNDDARNSASSVYAAKPGFLPDKLGSGAVVLMMAPNFKSCVPAGQVGKGRKSGRAVPVIELCDFAAQHQPHRQK